MSQPRFRTELRILFGCILIAFVAIVISTARWPREDETGSTFEARSEYRVRGTNVFPEFIRILQSEKGFEQKRQIAELLPDMGCKAMPLVPHLFPYGAIGSHSSVEEMRLTSTATSFLLTNDCPEFLGQALAQLAHEDRGVRNFAAFLLAPFGPAAREGIPSLVKMFDEGSGNAALALAAVYPDLPLLPERLVARARSTNAHWFERVSCVEALQVLGPKAARVSTETSQLLNKPPNLPSRGRHRMGGGTEIPISGDWDAYVITALGRMGPTASNALPAIKPYLTNSPPSRRLIAARSIVQIQPDAALLVPILTNVFEERDIPAFDFVFGVGFPDPVMRSSIRSSPDFDRLLQMNSLTAAACLLGEIGPAAKDALPALEGLAGIPGTSENLFASWAIARIRGQEKAFGARLLEELDSPGHLRYGYIEYVVAHFLARLGPDAEFALPRLELLARSSSGPVHAAAQKAITQIRDAIQKRRSEMKS